MLTKVLLLIFCYLNICYGKTLDILDFSGNRFKDNSNIRFASLDPLIDPGRLDAEFSVCASHSSEAAYITLSRKILIANNS